MLRFFVKMLRFSEQMLRFLVEMLRFLVKMVIFLVEMLRFSVKMLVFLVKILQFLVEMNRFLMKMLKFLVRLLRFLVKMLRFQVEMIIFLGIKLEYQFKILVRHWIYFVDLQVDDNVDRGVELKVDAEEVTFQSLLEKVLSEFGVEIDIEHCRLRRYYPQHQFAGQSYDDPLIQRQSVESAKWPKRGVHLVLETKEDGTGPFDVVNPNYILLFLFVVNDENRKALVDRGFVQSATFKAQDLPPGLCTLKMNMAFCKNCENICRFLFCK